MRKIKLTITESCCRSGYHKAGDVFIVEDLCPPLCRELWYNAYPYVFAARNGAVMDSGNGKSTSFTVRCPDGGRVCMRGELINEE
ncbi:MAG: TIGR04076 family protein [Oscillospiraceae bacterium]|nr:TIGR04076 family protein [Oscillospiraceae bacterium]